MVVFNLLISFGFLVLKTVTFKLLKLSPKVPLATSSFPVKLKRTSSKTPSVVTLLLGFKNGVIFRVLKFKIFPFILNPSFLYFYLMCFLK